MMTTKNGRKSMETKLFVGKSLVLFIGLSVLLASMSFGADTAETTPKRGKLAFDLRAGLASITAEGYGSSFSYGGGLFMHLSQRIGLEIVLDRYSVSVSKDLEGLGTGKMQVTPFLLNAQWRFPFGRFVPYAAAGAGFYFINFEPDPQVEPLADHEDHEDLVVADRFALHFGGGVDIQITRSLDFCADLRYSFIKTWIQARDEHHVDPADQDMFNLNTLVLALGIRYYF
jgi:opacity protein-like surface antigen